MKIAEFLNKVVLLLALGLLISASAGHALAEEEGQPTALVPYLVGLTASPECEEECQVNEDLVIDLSGCIVVGTQTPALTPTEAASAVEIDVSGTATPEGFYGFGMSTIGSIATPVEISLEILQVSTFEGGTATLVIFDMKIVHRVPGELHTEDMMVVDADGSIIAMGYESSCTFG